MAKRRVRSQIASLTPNQKKSRINPIYLAANKVQTYCWKALNDSYNFTSNRTSIRGLLVKLWGSKVAGIPIGAISGLPLGNPGREKPFRCGPCGKVNGVQETLKLGGIGLI